MFSNDQFKNHIWRVIGANCARVSQLLRDVPKGGTVDLFNILNRFTLDTIGSVGFARDIGSLGDAESPFLRSFDRAQQISLLRFIQPLWRIRRLLRIGEEGEARRHFQMLSDYSLETVCMLKEDSSGGKGNSFVGLFVQQAKKTGERVSDNFLKDMVLNFLIAGRDTTAQSLSWILYLVMDHPTVEAKILKEIDDVLGEEPISYSNTAKLKYLQNVINEGLRLYPSVPADSKICVQDDHLPDGTFIPAGAVVQFHPYAMGRSKGIWGEDAADFKPERWEGRDFPSSFVYPVFNAGPRECLGKRLAWVEMRAFLAEVLRAVRFELAVPRDAIKPDTQLTIGMSTGLPCHVFPR
jgi:cytochrome P450